MKQIIKSNKMVRFLALTLVAALTIQYLPLNVALALENEKVTVVFSSVVEDGNEVITIMAEPAAQHVEITGITLPDGVFVESAEATYTATENDTYLFDVSYRETVVEVIPPVDEAPVVEETTVIPETPAVEETTVIPEVPAVEETMVIPEAPIVEEVPVSDTTKETILPIALAAELETSDTSAEETAKVKIIEESKTFSFKTTKVLAIDLVESDANWFEFNKDTGTIVKFTNQKYSGAVVIPKEIDGVPVTAIGEWSFYKCLVTSVTIPEGVTSIGSYAFENCESLTSVTIPKSVTSIGDGAFSVCSALTSITIPESVTSIGIGVFGYCSALTSVTISENVTSIGEYAFTDCRALTSITIPESVTSIGGRAFADCRALTSITIPESVTSIEYYAFENCSALTSITIPESVTSIGVRTFLGTTALKNIDIRMLRSKAPVGVTRYEPWEANRNITTITYLPEIATNSVTVLDIPDPIFRQAILDKVLTKRPDPIDSGTHTLATDSPPRWAEFNIYDSDLPEIKKAIQLNIEGNEATGQLIESLKGIELFENLEELILHGQKALKTFDISNNLKLKSLSCDGADKIGTLDVSKNILLEFLSCQEAGLTSLDVTNNPGLTELACSANAIQTLDLSAQTRLQYLYASHNQLKGAFDLSTQTKLKYLYVYSNQLTGLNLSKNEELEILICHDNRLTDLDLTGRNKLSQLSMKHQISGDIEYILQADGTYTVDLSQITAIAGGENFESYRITAIHSGSLTSDIITFPKGAAPTVVQYKYDTKHSSPSVYTEMADVNVSLVQGTGKPLPDTHTVIFQDWNGTRLKSETVKVGTSATAPTDPTREGYTFKNWDVNFSNVTADLTVTATYVSTQVQEYTYKFFKEETIGRYTLMNTQKFTLADPLSPPAQDFNSFHELRLENPVMQDTTDPSGRTYNVYYDYMTVTVTQQVELRNGNIHILRTDKAKIEGSVPRAADAEIKTIYTNNGGSSADSVITWSSAFFQIGSEADTRFVVQPQHTDPVSKTVVLTARLAPPTVNPGTSEKPGASVYPGTSEKPGASVNPGISVKPGTSEKPGTSVNPGIPVNPGNSINPGAPESIIADSTSPVAPTIPRQPRAAQSTPIPELVPAEEMIKVNDLQAGEVKDDKNTQRPEFGAEDESHQCVLHWTLLLLTIALALFGLISRKKYKEEEKTLIV